MLEVGLSFGVLPQMLVPLMELTSPSELILVLIHTLYSVSEYTSFEWTSFLSHIFDSFPMSDALRVQSTAMDLSSHWVEGTIVIGEMLGRQILTIGELMIFFSWFLAVNVWLFSGEGPACTFWVFLRKYSVQLNDSSLRVAWTTGSQTPVEHHSRWPNYTFELLSLPLTHDSAPFSPSDTLSTHSVKFSDI